MDTNTNNTNQQLNQIVQGINLPVQEEVAEVIIHANKIKSKFLKMLVNEYREKKISDSIILDFIIEMDDIVESGKVDNVALQKRLLQKLN